jgi:uncharacterized membrane-anchored protein YitT (DUF2179 family)
VTQAPAAGHSTVRFVLWAAPGWIGLLSLWIQEVTLGDYGGWLFRTASWGMFLLGVTPVSVVFLVRLWKRAPGMTPSRHILFAALAAPTLVAIGLGLVLFFTLFIGVPM